MAQHPTGWGHNTYGLSRWSGGVTYVYFLHTVTEFFILGIVVGIVLGGSQALSRSFYGVPGIK